MDFLSRAQELDKYAILINFALKTWNKISLSGSAFKGCHNHFHYRWLSEKWVSCTLRKVFLNIDSKVIIGLLIHGCRKLIAWFYSFPSQADLMQKKIKGRFTYASQRAMRFWSAASDPFIDVDTVTLRQRIYSVHALTFRSKG